MAAADPLASLTAALKPKGGMRPIPLPVDSYEHPSKPLSARRLVNLLAEQQPGSARSEVALVSAPGLVLAETYGTGPVWAMNDDLPGRLYVVSGSRLFRVRPDNVPEDLGNVGTTTPDKIITIAVGPTAVVVCVPPRAYICGHSDPMNQIGGDSFPGASSVAYLDGYFVFTGADNDSRFFCSKLLDPSAYDALDFAYSDGLPNVVRRVVAHEGDLWMLGEAGVEVWTDTGAADFPFRRQSGGVIPYGSASPRSVALIDGSVWWVGTNCIVYRSVGYKAQRVSTSAIEAIIRMESAPAVVTALAYSQDGHSFYVLTFAGRTLVYDASSKHWHERSSAADGIGRWRPQCACLRSDIVLLGDMATGQVWRPDPGSGLDAGVAVRRMAVFPPLWGSTNRAFMHRLEVEMETGLTGDVLLDWSDDGGFTYGAARTLASGSAFEHRRRVVATRLGSFHQRNLRLRAQGRMAIYAADADITPGVGG